MGWFVVYVLLPITPIIALIGGGILWSQRRNSTAVLPLILVLVCIGIWGLSYSLELFTEGLDEKIFWLQMQYTSGAFLPFAAAAFLLRLAGWRAWPGRWTKILLYIVSAINCLGIWTNPWHQLFWQDPLIVDYGVYRVLQVDPGRWYWFYEFYAYALTISSLAAVLSHSERSSGQARGRLAWLFLGIGVPGFTNLLYLAGFTPLPGINLSILTFLIGAVVLGSGFFRSQFFLSTPLAHTTIIGHFRDGVLVLDKDGIVIDMNPAAEWVLGLDRKDILRRNISELNHALLEPVGLLLAGDTGPQEIARDIDGYLHWFEFSLIPLYERYPDSSRPQVGNLVVWHEITYQKEIEAELRYASTHDQLTGLQNRLMFEDNFKRLTRGRIWPVVIILADLDNMKFTNDTYGHAVGDELLRQSAGLLRESMRVDDYLARIGGDEFAVLLPGGDEMAAQAVVERLEMATTRYNLINTGLQVKLSIGWAVARAGEEMESAFQAADAAMYQEKAAHKLNHIQTK